MHREYVPHNFISGQKAAEAKILETNFPGAVMAHSIQTIGDKAVIFRDGELMDVIALLREELEMRTGYERARLIIEQWRKQLKGYTPGAIELDLDEITASAEDTAELLSLFEILRRRVSQSAAIPRETLAALCDAPGVIFHRDVPASSIVQTIDQLTGLLTSSRT